MLSSLLAIFHHALFSAFRLFMLLHDFLGLVLLALD